MRKNINSKISGFKPWQELLTAMMETRRAFAATWMDNGFGDTAGVL